MIAWADITAGEILQPIAGTLVSGSGLAPVRGVGTDTRNIRKGDLFWALQGERFDGHDFVAQALEAGAAGVVVQEDRWRAGAGAAAGLKGRHPDRVVVLVADTLKALGDLAAWWRRHHQARVVAVTGSSGKTTTKEMIAAILNQAGRTLKNKGNYNNLIGLPLTLLDLEKGVLHAVLEMGMNRFGEIGRLTEIADPDVGVITNVGKAHLEGVGDMEGVARAKTEMVKMISPDGAVVLNGDDALLMRAASRFRKPSVTFGFGHPNDIRAEGIRNQGKSGTAFRLCRGGESWETRLSVPGVHNVQNALAAAAAAFSLNMSADRVVEGLGRFRGMKGRFVLTELPGGVTLVDDTYNSNPSSLKAALDSAAALVQEGARLIVGLGEMRELGTEAPAAHREAGAAVAALGARLLLSMGEHAPEVVRGAREAGMMRGRTAEVESHREMAQRIRDTARAGDVVLIKGSRKMEMEKVAEEMQGWEPVSL